MPRRAIRPTLVIATVWLFVAAARVHSGEHRDAAAAEKVARETLAKFVKSEPGWQTHVQAVVAIVKAGPGAVPVLVEALRKGPTEARLLAGEVLKLVVEPGTTDAATRLALEAALEDREDSVREFAIHALNRLGGLDKVSQARRVLENDPNPGIRRVMAAALKGEIRSSAPAIRKALSEFDSAAIDSARLGQPAPDFTLSDTTGKTFRLSQFRGKKTVVLVFLVEDD